MALARNVSVRRGVDRVCATIRLLRSDYGFDVVPPARVMTPPPRAIEPGATWLVEPECETCGATAKVSVAPNKV